MRGILLHPHHKWFVNAAIGDEDLALTLDVAEECFEVVKREAP